MRVLVIFHGFARHSIRLQSELARRSEQDAARAVPLRKARFEQQLRAGNQERQRFARSGACLSQSQVDQTADSAK